MANTKEISRRIKSVSSTKKITKAMEMVSAAKMRKAVEAVIKTRTYANLSWETVLHLANLSQAKNEVLHPLLSARSSVKRVAVIVVTSNRGLCGGFNSAIIAKAKESIKKHDVETDIILVGKKGLPLAQAGYNIAAEFSKSDLILSAAETNPIARMAVADYLTGKYDKVMLAYTDFVSAVKQVPRVKQLLPVDVNAEDEYLGVVGKSETVGTKKDYLEEKSKKHLSAGEFTYDYTFEPGPNEVLDRIVPRLIEVQLYQALLESSASEHSASMAAMHQATEAASDMVSELTLFYNKARQASITAEIAEISAGANALNE
ncbi:MAG TPA: ATP synthase F1 subunit gamma [bacterium]|nr:ATP synthase F1 subunit gamma [bacterium]HPT29847.1 ATP synthase F1 subunit gamma [bacterium]